MERSEFPEPNERLRVLYEDSIRRHEAERNKLAFELHDDILNGLTSLIMTLDDQSITPAFLERYNLLTSRIRQIVNGLRPAALDQGLWLALEELIDETRTFCPQKTTIQFDIEKTSARYEPSVEGHLFRIVQQAVENACQHANAKRIQISGKLEDDHVKIAVHDDGKGFSTENLNSYETKPKHYGLMVMQERAAIIDADLTISSKIGEGTQVKIILSSVLEKQFEYHARVKAEQALAESQQNFRAVVDNAITGVFILDENGDYLYVNQRASDILQYTNEELLESNLKDIIHPGESEVILSRLKRRIQGENVPSQFETIVVRKDGKQIPVEVTATKTQWKNQPVSLGIFQDISQLKDVENAYRESEEKFKFLVENANDGILIADGEQNHLFVNQRVSDITGYSIEELQHLKTFQLIHPDEHRAMQQRIQNRLSRKPDQEKYETIVITKDGKSVPVEISSQLIRWEGKPAGLGFVRDISHRKQAKSELQDFRDSFDSSNDAIAIFDQDGKIVYANQKAADLAGYSISEFLNATIQTLSPEDEAATAVARFKSRFHGALKDSIAADINPPGQYDTYLRRKDGSIIEVNLIVIKTTWNRQDAILFIGRDLSEQIRVERALKENEALFRNLIKNANDAIAIFNQAGNLVYANQKGEELSGYSINELMGVRFTDLIPTPEIESGVKRFEGRFQGHSLNTLPPDQYDTFIRRKDGSISEVNLTVIQTVWNAEQAVLFIARDLTKQRRIEKTIQESDANFRAALDSASDGIVIVDQLGNHVFANQSFRKIIGYDWDELRKLNMKDIISADQIQKMSEKLNERFQGIASDEHIQIKFIHKSGEVIEVISSGVSITWQGEEAVMGIIRKISK